MVTELTEGNSLCGAQFTLRKSLDVALPIAEGLAALHAAGVAHRDRKPDKRVKILDFRLAKPEMIGAAGGSRVSECRSDQARMPGPDRPGGLSYIILLLLLAGPAAAQMRITDVVNAGSRIASGRFSSGIAQGALFVATGIGLGPSELQRASFPLPTTEGLGGVTIQAEVAGTTVDAIMVYVSGNQVAAILPSITPTGTGTLTVTNNGSTASRAITVVASAFGIFRQPQATYPSQALAFNVSADGSTTLNSDGQGAQPGQDVLINGTGLGAIASDETQSGVTDVPAATLQVYAGVKPAAIVSAGRGLCCDGIDPDYPIPPGIAAWDVIRFTVPEDVLGCFIPVVVQIGSFVSNIATISISADGGACVPPISGIPLEVTAALADKTGVSLGSISLSRTTGIALNGAGAITMNKRDQGSATFVRYPDLPASMIAVEHQQAANTCSINGYPDASGGVSVNGNSVPIVPLRPVSLDAGASLVVQGPSGTRSILRRTAGMLFDYGSANFGNSTPGNYFDPGHYTVTGPGGRDVGGFVASTNFPDTPFVWTDIPSSVVPPPIDRSKDLTVTWTGGATDSLVVVTGANFANGTTSAFQCSAPAGAGQITIPAYVLLSLPASGPAIISGLAVENTAVSTFTASGLDIATIRYSVGYSVSPRYQ